MLTSEFIYDSKQLEGKIQLPDTGATSLSYKVNIDGKQYFMKVLRPTLYKDLRNRLIFHKEFELGTSIHSEYVVKYERIGEDENGLHIIMEYIYGLTIEEKLNNDKDFFANEYNIYKLLLQLLEGFKAFHAKGIAYLDINPNNIMLTQIGNNVKIIDLGFCFNNAYGHTAGTTKEFAAPELIEKRLEEIDERTDIYAIGCLMKYIQEKSGTRYSRQYQEIMGCCLNKEKSKRYANTDEMTKAIRKRNRRRNVTMWVAAILIVGLIFATLWNKVVEEDYATGIFTVEGIEYRVLSHEERTCEVTGGNGSENNIYIYPEISIKNQTYRVVSIADSAFNGKDFLSAYIPEGIRTIGIKAFYECDSIVTISLPSTTTDLKNFSFSNMKRLKSVKFSPEMKTLGRSAFVDCVSLVSLYIPEGVERIQLDAFARCSALKDVSLPNTLKVIERGVFWKCTSLEKITLPASVEEIGDFAFYNCDKLRHIYNHAPVPPAITTITNNQGILIHVPASSLHLYKEHPNWKNYNIVGDV